MDSNELMDSLTWRELAEVEEYLGVAMDEWGSLNSKSKLAFGMQYILAKRKNEELSITEAEKMTIKQLSELAGMELVDSPKGDTQP